MKKRIDAIVSILARQFPTGEVKYGKFYYGWHVSTGEFKRFQSVDYSLQDIGGEDDVVRIWSLENDFELTIPANTLPPLDVLPVSSSVKMFRYIEGINDEV